MSVIVDLSLFPIGKEQALSQYVSRVLKIIKNSRLSYTLGPMGTSIEGEWSEVLQLIDKCFHEIAGDCSRIYMTIKADYRKGREGGLIQKVESVQSKIQKT